MTNCAPLASALVLLLTALPPVPGHPTGARGDRQQASWDQVNVVAHGLLQLGQALKEHVDKSRTQLRELSGGLRSLNNSLQRLEEARGTGEEGHRGTGLEGSQEVEELRRRMDRLEQRVEEVIRKPEADRNSSDGQDTFIQRLMAVQNRRMDQLLDKIRQQQDKLDKQSLHLQALHNKIAHKRMKSWRQKHNELQKDRHQNGLAKDCHELWVRGQRKSGVYTVHPQSSGPFEVLCDMTADGGWTVIQKRFDGSQSFEQTWDSYRRGFGRLDGEFWLGLDHIHALATQRRCQLHMELTDWSKQSQVISSEFQMDGAEKQFSLRLVPGSSTSSTSGSLASSSSGLPFSTTDRDNDLSCAQTLSGGWWFSSCGDSNLNGQFPSSSPDTLPSSPGGSLDTLPSSPSGSPDTLPSSPGGSRDMFWAVSGQRTVLKSTVMKMAPVSILH